MPRELTATEMKAATVKYLKRESDKHKGDIKRAEGQVQELDELISWIEDTCIFCSERIYDYSDQDRMGEHIAAKHSELESELSQG